MKTKICSNCKVEKDVCEFGKKITTSDGLQSRCKICRKIESKKDKEKYPNRNKIYWEKNKEKINLHNRERFEKNLHLKLIRNYRTRIKNYMRFNKISLGTGSLDLVGLTSEDLKSYLETKFLEGMSWDNYGLYGWHIDHIIPLSSAKNEEELKKLCHYTNLQPLWAFDNLSKCNKIIN